MEYLILNNGNKIPSLGMGTWKYPNEQVGRGVEYAISVGYRHIDCAMFYQNEKEVGEGLENVFKTGMVKRNELFVTSKVWNTHHQPEHVLQSCEQSLKDLRLDYLDLFLIHWPVAFQYGNDLFPMDENGCVLFDYVPIEDTWKAMEHLVDKGLVKSIGVSNFNKRQLQKILSICRIKPTVVQVEIHLDFLNQKLVEFAKSENIITTAYAPLGAAHLDSKFASLLTRPVVCDIAKRHGKSSAQVLLRHAIQRGLVVIPKSVNFERIKQNIEIFDFKLTDEEMKELNASSRNERHLAAELMSKHPEYPFHDEY